MRLTLRLSSVLLIVTLPACGGGGGGGGGSSPGSGVDPRLAQVDLYETQRLRVAGDPGAGVEGLAPTSAAGVPTSGRLDYRGGAAILVEGSDPRVLRGRAEVSFIFSDETGSGSVTQVFRLTDAGPGADYDGALTLDVLSAAAGHDGLVLTYDGSLSGEGQVLVFDGVLLGEFLGPGAGALLVSDFEAEIFAGGLRRDGIVQIVAEAGG